LERVLGLTDLLAVVSIPLLLVEAQEVFNCVGALHSVPLPLQYNLSTFSRVRPNRDDGASKGTQ
jgi:hypothetical protein